ncbi:anti-sigma factor [Sphingomonas paeninsulae]|uniref:Anti-sigma factor n=1 Tax=Sphingomonas paeninsulae TaxID=2319844 RepID=A0A494TB09_SPHPE|nr:anti-sigma factor [Sphingomonas paeninsulae]AYJ86260.1 anti-sigma factor [Sphingomonas paeninsulae]
MTFDDETLMAFADGELDPITTKRVEKAILTDPAVAERVAAHLSLREKMAAAYPLDTRPNRLADPLVAMIKSNTVVAMPVNTRPSRPRWLKVAGLAACLVAGVAVGTRWQSDQVKSGGGMLIASGTLARALETQVASAAGDPRMLVSFRTKSGDYCRVFAGQALDGIACKKPGGWQLIRTESGSSRDSAAYRQAGSGDSVLMGEAQNLMAGDPLSAAEEQDARLTEWVTKCPPSTSNVRPTRC